MKKTNTNKHIIMKHLLFVLILCLLAACNKEKEKIFEMTIASKTVKRVEPTGGVELDYLLAKWGKYIEWTVFAPYSAIRGFEYIEGYEYLLLVKETHIKNPPMDHRGVEYSLIEIISITKTESDIPPYYFN